MTTTTPLVFTGSPILTPEKGDLFNAWYLEILNNYDKVTEPVAKAYNAGAANIMTDMMTVLHDNPTSEAVVEVVKSNKFGFKKKVVLVVVVVIVLDGRLPKKIKSVFNSTFSKPDEPTKV